LQDENNRPSKIKDITIENNDTISQIFDKILKRILLALSPASVITFINGMFTENFPLDSEITYHYTEHVDGSLKKTVADIIITLRTKDRVRRFHLEGQINDDSTIVIRVFEYGFADALRHQATQGNKITLPFPTPAIIFLEHTEVTPDEVILELDFGESGKFNYPVKAMKFLTYSVEALCEKNMVILLPLYLLKLRRETDNAKKRKEKNREAALRQVAKSLKTLIEKSILPAIAESERVGDITYSDSFELLSLIDRLYDYLYGNITEFKEEETNAVLANILELKYDARLAREVKEQVSEQVKKQVSEQVKQANEQANERLLKERRETARSLKEDGVPIAAIIKATKLPVYEIEKL